MYHESPLASRFGRPRFFCSIVIFPAKKGSCDKFVKFGIQPFIDKNGRFHSRVTASAGRAQKNRPGKTGAIKIQGSVFGRVGGQILFDHQGHLEDDGIVELAQIKAGELLDLFQTIDQGVAVHEQAAACLGNVQVVFKEALDGEQRFGIQAVDAVLLEDFLQEGIAQGGGQLVDQAGDAQVIVGDDW